MDVQSGARLGLEHRIELLPSLVEKHGVLQNARRVDEAHKVWGFGLDVLVNGLRVAAVALGMLD
eukprot:11947496-Heterocapsa_arctica.AAC.1